MTPEELQAIVDSTAWTFLDQGGYHDVFVSDEPLNIAGYEGYWVLKKNRYDNPKNDTMYLAIPGRSIKKWKSLNPDYPIWATDEGWIVPYLGDTPASDEQISNKLIDIYRKTRNIVGDAAAKGENFLVYNNDVICIDIDHAFRRNSIASQTYGAATSKIYAEFLKSCAESGHPQTARVINTLFYLEKNLEPSDIDDKYIIARLIKILDVFCYQNEIITVDILDLLLEIINLDPAEELKDRHLSPKFIQTLQCRGKDQPILSKNVLRELIKLEILSLEARDIIAYGDIDEVKTFIEHRKECLYQTDQSGYTLLHYAAQHGNIEIADYLVQEGANIEALTSERSRTAMDLAVAQEHVSMAMLLIERGARVSPAVDGQVHAIHLAAKSGLIDIVRALIQNDASLVHATDIQSQTPLLWAACYGHQLIVEFLLAHGARQDVTSQLQQNYPGYAEKHHASALDWATHNGHCATVLALFNAGVVANKSTVASINENIIKGLIKLSVFNSPKENQPGESQSGESQPGMAISP